MYNNNQYNPYMNYLQPQYGQQYGQQSYTLPMQNGVVNNQNTTTNSQRLQGKIVESIDVVKGIDIPLDGSTSYFPTADGNAIVSKTLQANGTSKMNVYKRIEEETEEPTKYITLEDFKELNANIKEIMEHLKIEKSE